MSDLSLVPTDDLLDALKARFDHMIFSGLKIGGTGRDDEEHRRWHGHGMYCQALAMELVRAVQDWERAPEASAGDEA